MFNRAIDKIILKKLNFETDNIFYKKKILELDKNIELSTFYKNIIYGHCQNEIYIIKNLEYEKIYLDKDEIIVSFLKHKKMLYVNAVDKIIVLNNKEIVDSISTPNVTTCPFIYQNNFYCILHGSFCQKEDRISEQNLVMLKNNTLEKICSISNNYEFINILEHNGRVLCLFKIYNKFKIAYFNFFQNLNIDVILTSDSEIFNFGIDKSTSCIYYLAEKGFYDIHGEQLFPLIPVDSPIIDIDKDITFSWIDNYTNLIIYKLH